MPREEVHKLIAEAMRLRVFLAFLDEVRKPFVPQCGAGSQNQNFDIHRLLNKLSEDNMAANERRWEDY